jgi:hypothetical protein
MPTTPAVHASGADPIPTAPERPTSLSRSCGASGAGVARARRRTRREACR